MGFNIIPQADLNHILNSENTELCYTFDREVSCVQCAICYIYLATELDEIIDNVTNIQRQNSSTKCLAHLSIKCSVSFCDHSPSVGVRLSVLTKPTL